MQDTQPSVHTKETTGTGIFEGTYQAHCNRSSPEESKAVRNLYLQVETSDAFPRTDRLDACRLHAYFVRDIESGEVRVFSNQCRLRWCPLCARARERFLAHTVNDWLMKTKKPKFLTLTLKHSRAPLEFQIRSLYDAFRSLRKTKLLKSKVRGGCWFFQLKKSSRTDEWHPHLHCLIDSEWLPHSLLSSLWLQITKTSTIVDIRPVNNRKKAAEYVARYATRPCKMAGFTEDERQEVFTSMHGKRIVGTWGSGRIMVLKPQKLSNSSDWVRIASWDVVVHSYTTNTVSLQILQAFLHKKPLEAGVDLIDIERFLDGWPDIESDEMHCETPGLFDIPP